MSIEEEIKRIVITKYGSIRQFANDIEIPYTTIQSIFNRGINNAGMQNVIKICQALGIDTDALAEGKIEERKTHDNLVTVSEKEHIKKYRSLSEHGKKMADTFLDMQYEYEKEESMKIKESYPMIPKVLYGCSPSAGVGNYLPDDIDESAIMVPDTPKTKKADYVLKVDGKSMEPEYMDGDLVLVKKQDQVDIGEVGIYLVDGEALIKEAQNGYLHSLNPEFGNIDLNENSEVHCMGKVIGKL